MTPKQRTRVAWLVTWLDGRPKAVFNTQRDARDFVEDVQLATTEIRRLTYPWPVRTRAKK
jgi:hypothetical protein